jgi:hypothetical protein
VDPDDLEDAEGEQRGGQAERDLAGAGRSAGEPGGAEDPQRPGGGEYGGASDPAAAGLQAEIQRSGGGDGAAEDTDGDGGIAATRPAVACPWRPVRRILTGSEAEIPRLGETIVRTVTVGSIDTVAAARLHADLVITPRVEQIGLMDWKALPRAAELGRRAAREALEADPELLSRLGD